MKNYRLFFLIFFSAIYPFVCSEIDVQFSFLGLASAAIGLGGAIAGGIKSRKAKKKAKKEAKRAQAELDKEKGFNDILFNREYYQDYLQRSENQAALKLLRDKINERNKVADQSAVVTGATPEAVAKQKESSNQMYGDVVSNIAANSSSVKDNVMNRYLNQRQNLLNGNLGLINSNINRYNNESMQWGNFLQNSLNTMASALGGGTNVQDDVLKYFNFQL